MPKWMKGVGAVIAFVVGLAGMVLGAWPFVFPPDKKQIAYEDSRFLLIDQSKVDNQLIVSDISGKPVEGNLYALTIYIWNSGPQPIFQNTGQVSDSVIEPYRFALEGGDAKFRSMRIAKLIDQYANRFFPNLLEDGIHLSWRRFLPDTGLRLEAIVEAKQDFTLALRGRMVEVEAVTAEERVKSLRTITKTASYVLGAPILAFIIFAVGYMVIGLLYMLYRSIVVISKKLRGFPLDDRDAQHLEGLIRLPLGLVIMGGLFGYIVLFATLSSGIDPLRSMPKELRQGP